MIVPVAKRPHVFAVAGCAGCGKTTFLKEILALVNSRDDLGIAPMYAVDGDVFHEEESVVRMSEAIPVSSVERNAWLGRVRTCATGFVAAGISVAMACSLLKPDFRRDWMALFPMPDRSKFPYGTLEATAKIFWISCPPDVLRERAQRRWDRREHWFHPSLVERQIQAATQIIDGETYLGPVPGREEGVYIVHPTSNPRADAEEVLRQAIPHYADAALLV